MYKGRDGGGFMDDSERQTGRQTQTQTHRLTEKWHNTRFIQASYRISILYDCVGGGRNCPVTRKFFGVDLQGIRVGIGGWGGDAGL